ncbi:MAG TPA: alcohol dehydrogenase catalytic domain-containing protein [Candidatus Ratteibacteria bacterium]|uniref:Sorbitol dehydrogenase n=1 Tax=candidate division TA06 bacterium ADurb.Bin131 TaxID=1852827 RepID=A0A1V6C8L7_UNCT6|nr:MAG: Sorbitol dehydrogenase [candidate division TA06 bacterium ADurb.Bin131]HOC03244.1 alcohol dehydrogenase catalytic domain-containing protein [bacterium]HRS07078.1 alcohol dehydrogenase catalytic domain-containing protein [Candidatus Ratteibacteria bacterium]
MKKGKAAFLLGKQKFVIDEIEVPVCKENEVLVRIKAVGVCGSDAHYFQDGRIGDQIVPEKFIIGHEASGEVVETGRNVKSVRPGDRVVIEPGISCGECQFCITGRPNLCPHVKFLGTPPVIGAFRQYIAMPEKNIIKLPDELSFAEGTLAEPLAIALYGVRLSNFQIGDSVVILGTGPIGLSVLFCCKIGGASKIITTEIIKERAEMAKKIGADYVYLADKQDVVEEILKNTENSGVDIAYECAGQQETINQMISVSSIGGTSVIFGIPAEDTVSFDPHIVRRKQLPIITVRRSAFMTEAVLQLMCNSNIKFSSIITHLFPLEKIQEALEIVSTRSNGVIKAIIEP